MLTLNKDYQDARTNSERAIGQLTYSNSVKGMLKDMLKID